MWTDISLDNRKALLKMVERFEGSLGKFKALLRKSDAKGLYRFLDSTAKVRRKL